MDTGFKSEAEGYAASVRQQADWVHEAQEGNVHFFQRIDIGDIDVDELRAVADFIERQAKQIEIAHAALQMISETSTAEINRLKSMLRMSKYTGRAK